MNAKSPAYFGQQGFISAGFAPGGMYRDLEDMIKTLVPYNPLDIALMKIEFAKFQTKK